MAIRGRNYKNIQRIITSEDYPGETYIEVILDKPAKAYFVDNGEDRDDSVKIYITVNGHRLKIRAGAGTDDMCFGHEFFRKIIIEADSPAHNFQIVVLGDDNY